MRKLGLIALLVLLCLSGAALAQTSTDTFCGDLSQADCTILTNAEAAQKTLDSASFDLTVNMTVTNVPNTTAPVVINLTGNGSYSGLSAFRNMDMSAMQTDPGAFLTNVLDNFDADLTLTLNLPPEVTAQAGANVPSSLTLQVRLVDGIGYVNFDTLQPLLAQMGNMNLHGWGGLDLASLLRGALQQQPDLFNNMQVFGNNAANHAAIMQQFHDPNTLKKFVTITRTDSGTGDTATFRTTVDLAALMALPEFQDMMRQQMQMQQSQTGQTMTQQEMDQAMQMSAAMFQNMTITVDQEIGLSDNFIHSIHGTVTFDTSAMMSMNMMNSNSSGTTSSAQTNQPAPVVTIDFTINYSNFNSAPAITAPENAVMFPWQSLLGLSTTGGTPQATGTMTMTPTPTFTPTVTPQSTSEMTAEPTSEMTTEPTFEVTLPVTEEPTAEVTAGS